MNKKSVIVFSSSDDFISLLRLRLKTELRIFTSNKKTFRDEIIRVPRLCCILTESTFLNVQEYLELRSIATQEMFLPLFIFSSEIHDIFYSDAHRLVRVHPLYGNNAHLLEQIKSFPVLSTDYVVQRMPTLECHDNAYPVAMNEIIGDSPAIHRIKQTLCAVSKSMMAVLFLGPSGTGKTFYAQILHKLSARKGRFCSVNIAAIPKDLIATTLFGSTRGAFTDAIDKDGYFSASEGGTLFLDEIGDMPLEVQTMLLNVLESRQYSRVGSYEVHTANVRMLFATNKNLKEMIAEGNFREDLYYRICGFVVQVPPLRERMEDIPLLANSFLKEHNKSYRFSHESLEKLQRYSWPGNIRQLRNCIERACVLCRNNTILEEHIIFE